MSLNGIMTFSETRFALAPPLLQGGQVLRILHLFSGTNSTAQAFVDRGHEVVSVDNVPDFKPTICADVLSLSAKDLPGPWDAILAGCPCQGMVVMRFSANWHKPGVPRAGTAGEIGYALLRKTLELVAELRPRAFIIENPRAMMRKLPEMKAFDRRTVTYCQYGAAYQKPTDLFGHFPPTLKLHAACGPNSPCHEPAPRGSPNGVMGLDGAEERSRVPYALSMAFCMALENWHGGGVGRQTNFRPVSNLEGSP